MAGIEMPIGLVIERAPLGNLFQYIMNVVKQKRSSTTQHYFTVVSVQIAVYLKNCLEDNGLVDTESVFYGCYMERKLLLKISLQIITGLNYLHENNVIYRDLKVLTDKFLSGISDILYRTLVIIQAIRKNIEETFFNNYF